MIVYASINDNVARFAFEQPEVYEDLLVKSLEGSYVRSTIYDYYKIDFDDEIHTKNISMETAKYFLSNFQNEILICVNVYNEKVDIWYSDKCSDLLKTTIELMCN